jgi:tetratricopeptide (TPR) repeat protein/cold shock CspA family protein
MSEYQDLKNRAGDARKGKRYDEAVQLYESVWTNFRDQCDEWDGWGYAYTLRKLGRSKEALQVAHEVYEQVPDFSYNSNLYAWCLYDVYMKQSPQEAARNESAFMRSALQIAELCQSDPYSQFSPYVRTVFQVIDYFKAKPTNQSGSILAWTDKLDPAQLSEACGQGPGRDGRTVEYASDREKWYAARTAALLDAEQYQACIDLAKEALGSFARFHYDNDVWFHWRIAQAHAELGEHEAAIPELEGMLSRKRDWFVYHRIAESQYALGEKDKALTNAATAAQGRGDLEYKWKLFLLMGRLLHEKGQEEAAQKHVALAARLCDEQEWDYKPELVQALQDLDVQIDPEWTSQSLYRELRDSWKALRFADRQQMQGYIKTMLPHGKAGFITGDSGEDYYFRTGDFRGRRGRLDAGLRVTFYVEKNPNPKQSDNAVSVQEAKE